MTLLFIIMKWFWFWIVTLQRLIHCFLHCVSVPDSAAVWADDFTTIPGGASRSWEQDDWQEDEKENKVFYIYITIAGNRCSRFS